MLRLGKERSMVARFVLAFAVFVLALGVPGSPPTLAAGSDGETLYVTNCSGCHGVNGQGAVNIAPPLAKNPFVTGTADKAIRAVLGGMIGPVTEHGRTWNGSMPVWQGTLTNAQLAAVLSYIRRSWGNRAAPVTAAQVAAVGRVSAGQPSAPKVTLAAASLYATNCSGCHGANGEGAINIAPPLAKNPYVVGDPKRVIHTVLNGLIGPVREKGATWNGSMPAWQGTLSDAQVAAVLTFIRDSWGNRAAAVTAGQVAAVK
jgi:mono/diheme cytochrome c family protein